MPHCLLSSLTGLKFRNKKSQSFSEGTADLCENPYNKQNHPMPLDTRAADHESSGSFSSMVSERMEKIYECRFPPLMRNDYESKTQNTGDRLPSSPWTEYRLARTPSLSIEMLCCVDQLVGESVEEPIWFIHYEHVFRIRPKCDGECSVCSRMLRTPIMPSRRLQCAKCNVNIHKRCLANMKRECITSRWPINSITTTIPTNYGLCAQDYKCAVCKVDIGFQTLFAEPFFCDYTGKYHCEACQLQQHRITMPFRVLRSWEFAEQPVSLDAREFLLAIDDLPLFKISEINQSLFNHVEDLRELDSLRKTLVGMSSLLLTCRQSRAEKILHKFQHHRHFLDSALLGYYSMHDLKQLHDGKLLPVMQECITLCESHITQKCKLCYGRGHLCEVCSSQDVIFGFQNGVWKCSICRRVFHLDCFQKTANGECPHCLRSQKRRLESDKQLKDEKKS